MAQRSEHQMGLFGGRTRLRRALFDQPDAFAEHWSTKLDTFEAALDFPPREPQHDRTAMGTHGGV